MSEDAVPKNWMSTAGAWAIGIGFFIFMIETFIPGESALGTGCCCLGVFGLVAGGIVSSSGAAVSSDGKMVLKQDSTGQWKWVENTLGNQEGSINPAVNYNDQSSQIMSRVIQEVRGGKTLQELEPDELDIVASAYGVDSGSKSQKIAALHNSQLAKMGLQLGALGVAGGAGAVGAAHIIKSGREKAIERAEELREQGRQKLQENIEQGKYLIDSKLPETESGEKPTEVAHNIILEQLSKQIEEKNLTPEMFIEISDFNKDGKLDPVEIAGALTAATGFAVPLFIVKDAMKGFDLNQDGTLDIEEMDKLWAHLGFDLEDDNQLSDEEIDAVLDEVENTNNETHDDSSIESQFAEHIQQIGESGYLESTHIETGQQIDGKWATWTIESIEEKDGLYWVTATSKQQQIQTDELNRKARFVLFFPSPDDLIEGHAWTNGEWTPHFSTGNMDGLVFDPNSQENQTNIIPEQEEAEQQVELDEPLPVEQEQVKATDGELTEGIDTEFERLVLEMESARFSSERRELMEKHASEFLVNLRIEKMERTLIGDPVYRGGQSVHALIDGGPYVGVIKMPVSCDEMILECKKGDVIQVWGKLVDFSPSLKRPVLEASKMA